MEVGYIIEKNRTGGSLGDAVLASYWKRK